MFLLLLDLQNELHILSVDIYKFFWILLFPITKFYKISFNGYINYMQSSREKQFATTIHEGHT
uniref:Uncharacterized protein n=1 Tax=Arundo donax TaxID=35708 RepID=A0A0A9GVA8_ARUDO